MNNLSMLLERTTIRNIYFYHVNREKLKQNYSGRYLLIKDEKLVGDYSSWMEACTSGLQFFNNDDFFIKHCS